MSYFADTTCGQIPNNSFSSFKRNESISINKISTNGYVVVRKDIDSKTNNTQEEKDPLNVQEKKAIHDSFIK